MQTLNCFAKRFSQTYENYLNEHEEYQFSDKKYISRKGEKLNPGIISTVVDYLTKYLFFPEQSIEKIFKPAVMGAKLLYQDELDSTGMDLIEELQVVPRKIDTKIVDDLTRATYLKIYYQTESREVLELYNNFQTLNLVDCSHILKITDRYLNFLDILKDHSTTILPAYEVKSDRDKTIYGNGDFLTDKAIINFKVYSKIAWKHNNNSTILAAYYLLGRYGINSNDDINWENIKFLVLFDARLNRVEYINIEDYAKEIEILHHAIQKELPSYYRKDF